MPLQTFTTRKDQNVPRQSLYRHATFWSKVTVKDANMWN